MMQDGGTKSSDSPVFQPDFRKDPDAKRVTFYPDLWVMENGNYVILQCWDEHVSIHNARPLQDGIQEYFDRGATRFIIDFPILNFVDSTFLGILATLSKKLKSKHPNARVVLAIRDGEIVKLLTKYNLLCDYAIVSTLESAEEKVNG